MGGSFNSVVATQCGGSGRFLWQPLDLTFCFLGNAMAVEGKWKADQLKLELTAEGEGVWHLSAQVANTMNCKVTKAGESYSAGPVSSTRMLPPPDLQEKEREVSNLLANLNSISVEGGQLKISSDSSSLLLDPAQE